MVNRTANTTPAMIASIILRWSPESSTALALGYARATFTLIRGVWQTLPGLPAGKPMLT